MLWHIVMDTEPPIPASIGGDLRDFLELCFIKDPEQRPAAVVLFEHPWIKKLNPDLVSTTQCLSAGKKLTARLCGHKIVCRSYDVSAWIYVEWTVRGCSHRTKAESWALERLHMRTFRKRASGTDTAWPARMVGRRPMV